MLSTADFAKGVRFLHKGEPHMIIDTTVQSATARGGGTLVRIKARNLLTGKFISESFKAGTKFEIPDLAFHSVQFLYTDGNDAVFMDQGSYEQFTLSLESLEEELRYLTEELKIKAMYFNGKPVSIDLPPHVELTVSFVEPGTRGNTATGNVLTRAELSNKMECQVPLSIKEGDRILVDTATHTFYSRAQVK